MPTYGYECLGCGNSFETVQRITDDTLTQCELCGGVLRKKIFPVGIVFKGSGFYVNDYATKKGASEDSAPAKVETPPSDGTAPAASSTDSTESTVKAPEAKPAETKAAETPATAPSAPAKPAA